MVILVNRIHRAGKVKRGQNSTSWRQLSGFGRACLTHCHTEALAVPPDVFGSFGYAGPIPSCSADEWDQLLIWCDSYY